MEENSTPVSTIPSRAESQRFSASLDDFVLNNNHLHPWSSLAAGNQVIYEQKPSPSAPAPPEDWTRFLGFVLLLCSHFVFVVSFYAIIVSKWMPETGNKILDAIREDRFYCYLIPMTIPVAITFVVWNWIGMKLFRHN
jgi:hypothetical protein